MRTDPSVEATRGIESSTHMGAAQGIWIWSSRAVPAPNQIPIVLHSGAPSTIFTAGARTQVESTHYVLRNQHRAIHFMPSRKLASTCSSEFRLEGTTRATWQMTDSPLGNYQLSLPVPGSNAGEIQLRPGCMQAITTNWRSMELN